MREYARDCCPNSMRDALIVNHRRYVISACTGIFDPGHWIATPGAFFPSRRTAYHP